MNLPIKYNSQVILLVPHLEIHALSLVLHIDHFFFYICGKKGSGECPI